MKDRTAAPPSGLRPRMFKVIRPPLPGLEFELLNALVPFVFMIGIRGPTLVREPVVRVKSGGVTPFWSLLPRKLGKKAGASTIRMLHAVMVLVATAETDVPVMF